MVSTSGTMLLTVLALGGLPSDGNWYRGAFYLLHEDHHTQGTWEVGRDADPAVTARLIGRSHPDVIQIHAKGNPGWTTYPSDVGYTPARLRNDVMGIWRDLAAEHGYRFSAYFNLGRDGQIMERHPEWNRSTADGREVDRALCYHSGVAEAYLWPMIDEIMQRYRPDGWWFDGSCFTVRLCYCDACRARFRKETGLPAPVKSTDPGWRSYHEMQRQVYREFIRATAKRIHVLDPRCLVAVNWAYSLRMPEAPDGEFAYLTGDIGNRVEGLSAAAHWYDAQPLPFDLMTQLNTRYTVDGARRFDASAAGMYPKPAVQLHQEMAIVIANGGRFWVWDNPTPESGLVAQRHEFLGKSVAPFLRARQPWCLNTKRLPDISVLNASAAHYALTDAKGPVCFSRSDNRIDGAATWLPQLHLNYEFISDRRLHAMDIRSPALVVEHPKQLAARDIDALQTYVTRGGTLLVTGMGAAIGKGQPLAGVLGIRNARGPAHAEPLTVDLNGRALRFDHFLFRCECRSARRVLDVRTSAGAKLPLMTVNQFGKGRAYYFATPLLSLHGKNEIPLAVMEAVFEQIVPAQQRRLTGAAPRTVELVLRARAHHQILHLVNLASGTRETTKFAARRYVRIDALPAVPPTHVSIRLAQRPQRVVLQPQGKTTDSWRYANGRLELDVPSFAVHQIVEIRTTP